MNKQHSVFTLTNGITTGTWFGDSDLTIVLITQFLLTAFKKNCETSVTDYRYAVLAVIVCSFLKLLTNFSVSRQWKIPL